MERVIVLSAVTALLVGCTPRISEPEALTLSREAAPLLATIGELKRESWPASVAALNPEKAYVRPEGMYVAVSSFFVEESGLFVLNSASGFAPASGADPSYEAIGHGVYAYRIKG